MFFFFPSKFSNWLSSDWISVHLKLGGDTNRQKPKSVFVVDAVVISHCCRCDWHWLWNTRCVMVEVTQVQFWEAFQMRAACI